MTQQQDAMVLNSITSKENGSKVFIYWHIYVKIAQLTPNL